jgi:phage terminase large subunit-like protein
LTRGQKVILFIETYCLIPEGEKVGQKVVLEKFQKRFIVDVYDNPHVTYKAILSMARKNAKTALTAMLLLAHIAGPLAVENSRIVSGAQSREQAAEVYNALSKMIRLSPELSERCKIIPSSKEVVGLSRNVSYKAISAEAKTAHGKSPIVAVLDEVGQIRGATSDFVDAITTAQGAYASPLLIYISTQAANDSDFLSIEIDNALKSQDPKIVCHVYAADKDCDLLDREQWIKANPGAGSIRSIDDIERQAKEAHQMPTKEPAFRNLLLNQRVEINSPFLPRQAWEAIKGDVPEFTKKDRVWIGLDLSSVRDLTAAIAITQRHDVWQLKPTFWLPENGLSQKSRDDRVPYDTWVKQGHLNATAGAVVDYSMVAHELRSMFTKWDVQAVGFDAHLMNFLKPWLEQAGFTASELERFVSVRQGAITMTPFLKDFESLVYQKKLMHDGNPVMNMCCQNATVTSGATEMRMLVKSKATGRIDGMVAAAMAIGIRHTTFAAAQFEHRQTHFDLNTI